MKMSARLWFVVLIILIIVLSSCILYSAYSIGRFEDITYFQEPDPVFYPEFYDWGIRHFPSDLQIDPIADYKAAAQAGQALWDTVLKESANPGKQIEVFYVQKDDTWVIMGTSPDPKHWTGVIPAAIIQSDGTVLAVFWA